MLRVRVPPYARSRKLVAVLPNAVRLVDDGSKVGSPITRKKKMRRINVDFDKVNEDRTISVHTTRIGDITPDTVVLLVDAFKDNVEHKAYLSRVDGVWGYFIWEDQEAVAKQESLQDEFWKSQQSFEE